MEQAIVCFAHRAIKNSPAEVMAPFLKKNYADFVKDNHSRESESCTISRQNARFFG